MKLKVLSTVGLALSLGLTSLGSDGTAFAEKPDDSYFYQIKINNTMTKQCLQVPL